MVVLSAKGVVWDLDGTLLDSFKLQEDVLTEVLQRRGIAVPAHEVFVNHYHGRLRDSIQGISGVEGALLEAIYDEFIQSEERHYVHPNGLFYPDAIDLLGRNHAAGLKQIIVSNRPHYNDGRLGSPRNLVKRKPLLNLVDAVVCGDDNDFHKPDARLLDEAERNLGLERSELVVIGDQFVDVELAHNLGVHVVLVLRTDEGIPHLERLADGWKEYVSIVKSLREVSIAA